MICPSLPARFGSIPFLTDEAAKRGFEVGQVYEIYTEHTIRYVFQSYPKAHSKTGETRPCSIE